MLKVTVPAKESFNWGNRLPSFQEQESCYQILAVLPYFLRGKCGDTAFSQMSC